MGNALIYKFSLSKLFLSPQGRTDLKICGTDISYHFIFLTTTIIFMTTQNQLGFISDKIRQLQTAILYCHSNSVLQIPASLVHSQHVDEEGCIWMYINKPDQYVHEFDSTFHVALNYYKKGTPFFLNTYGIARVVDSTTGLKQLPPDLLQAFNNNKLLICIRILEANYYENQPKPAMNLLQKCTQSLSNLFLGSNDYYYFNEEQRKYVA